MQAVLGKFKSAAFSCQGIQGNAFSSDQVNSLYKGTGYFFHAVYLRKASPPKMPGFLFALKGELSLVRCLPKRSWNTFLDFASFCDFSSPS